MTRIERIKADNDKLFFRDNILADSTNNTRSYYKDHEAAELQPKLALQRIKHKDTKAPRHEEKNKDSL